MRLIDADLLKKNCKCTGTFESNFQCVSLKTLGDLIDAQPTAYEVDKVLGVVKEASYERFRNTGMGGELVVNLDDAIEIINGGGKE